ncbi:hypothetical protein DIE23_12510 [Burkholderia sp. Bp9143]|uniref:hypothetical protein n=1 Tax=Burkholderia sp. Bp9143 TaxID=2184574 RepID=UPI000F5A3273|nr:hypothetical protein [Burkholderia sp. Bp9143]RQR34437.1 hypothetical protein DIE23_12510 [Burkholderia sp. Bp9143]
MKPVPHECFIDPTDDFSVLLPGALLAWLMMGRMGPVVLGHRHAKLDGVRAWAALLFASHFFGHRVFLLGSCDRAPHSMLKAQLATTGNRITP